MPMQTGSITNRLKTRMLSGSTGAKTAKSPGCIKFRLSISYRRQYSTMDEAVRICRPFQCRVEGTHNGPANRARRTLATRRKSKRQNPSQGSAPRTSVFPRDSPKRPSASFFTIMFLFYSEHTCAAGCSFHSPAIKQRFLSFKKAKRSIASLVAGPVQNLSKFPAKLPFYRFRSLPSFSPQPPIDFPRSFVT